MMNEEIGTLCMGYHIIKTDTPFEWLSTIPGAKIVELTLLAKKEMETPSLEHSSWPLLDTGKIEVNCYVPEYL